MNRITYLALAIGSMLGTTAQAAYIYSPSEYANQSGNTNNIIWSPNGDTHGQWVFGSSVFGQVPVQINGFSVRFATSYTNETGNVGVYDAGSSFHIELATKQGMASTNFSTNLANAQTVMSGPTSIPFTIGGTGGQLKPFGVTFAFDHSYVYDPAAGDLLIDYLFPQSKPGYFGTMDFLSSYYYNPYGAYPSNMYRVFANDPNATSGDIQQFIPVVRFDVGPVVAAVPEPASWTMLILGMGMIGYALRRRSSIQVSHA